MWNFFKRTSLYILAIPALVFGLGLLSNQAVIFANHDKFPVMYNEYKVNAYRVHLERELAKCQAPDLDVEAAIDTTPAVDPCEPIQFQLEALKFDYLDDTHVIMTSKTHLNFLADWIDLKEATYSIGDFLLMLGEWLGAFAPFLFAFDVIRKLTAQA
jgi:hypothetical protein